MLDGIYCLTASYLALQIFKTHRDAGFRGYLCPYTMPYLLLAQAFGMLLLHTSKAPDAPPVVQTSLKRASQSTLFRLLFVAMSPVKHGGLPAMQKVIPELLGTEFVATITPWLLPLASLIGLYDLFIAHEGMWQNLQHFPYTRRFLPALGKGLLVVEINRLLIFFAPPVASDNMFYLSWAMFVVVANAGITAFTMTKSMYGFLFCVMVSIELFDIYYFTSKPEVETDLIRYSSLVGCISICAAVAFNAVFRREQYFSESNTRAGSCPVAEPLKSKKTK
jgi:hypothetical protein